MKHKNIRQSEHYKVEGDKVVRTKRECSRCGDGTFMAEHENRWYCGRCAMTVWKSSEKDASKE